MNSTDEIFKFGEVTNYKDAATAIKDRLDYIRCSFLDLNGTHMTKLISVEQADKLNDRKVEVYPGVIGFGPRFEFVAVSDVFAIKNQNGLLVANWGTLHSLPWLDKDEQIGLKRIGCVLCDLHWPYGGALEAMPRVAAERMVTRLRDVHKLIILSAFEPEFRLFKKESVDDEFLSKPSKLSQQKKSSILHKKSIPQEEQDDSWKSKAPKPITYGEDYMKTDILRQMEKFFMRLDTHLKSIGIKVQDFMVENGESQVETPMEPLEGLASADSYVIMKQTVREIADSCGMFASFMTHPILNGHSNGNHFNFSLWREENGDKTNIFYDASTQKKKKISLLGMHFIGGIMHHMRALTALCSPTVNCYRRLKDGWAPTRINWDFHDRFMSLRVKDHEETNPYMENRLSSSAASPYIVMAATLAAGMDGIERQLLPPEPGLKDNHKAPLLPSNLGQAIGFLRADETLVKILGKEFVDWFCRAKYEDLKKMPYAKSSGPLLGETQENEAFLCELHEYFQYI
ncbi:hypothetical protein Ciccas_000848 [Cichlidogyrus casuarinus]|uniref:Lengsin n=1 Tax=Cichlidogyrus casuarinus TaxID=1844966 RepID=A0ABD2QM08_9PLAT